VVVNRRRARERSLTWQCGVALLAALTCGIACGRSSRHSSAGEDTAGSSAVGGKAGVTEVASAGSFSTAGAAGAPELPHGGGAAGTAGTAPEPVEPFAGTTEEYWTQVVQTELAREEECFGVPADHVMLGSNVVSAHFWVEQQVEQRLRDVQPSIDAGFARFDRQIAAACLQRMLTQSCEALLLDVAHDDKCVDHALIGTVPPGGACERAVDCAQPDQFCFGLPPDEPRVCTSLSGPGQSCDFIGCARGNECVQTRPDIANSPAFTCVPKPLARKGDACSFGDCDQGLVCLNQVCRDYQLDAPCTSNIDCLYLQACLHDPTGVTGHCGRPRAEGETCSGNAFDNDCAFSFDCRANAQRQLVCTSVWAPVGALCRNTGANGGIVCIDGYCDVVSSSNQEGVCVAAHQEGEQCFVGSCAPGLDCTEAGCQPEPF
jgi:hypothetical protein